MFNWTSPSTVSWNFFESCCWSPEREEMKIFPSSVTPKPRWRLWWGHTSSIFFFLSQASQVISVAPPKSCLWAILFHYLGLPPLDILCSYSGHICYIEVPITTHSTQAEAERDNPLPCLAAMLCLSHPGAGLVLLAGKAHCWLMFNFLFDQKVQISFWGIVLHPFVPQFISTTRIMPPYSWLLPSPSVDSDLSVRSLYPQGTPTALSNSSLAAYLLSDHSNHTSRKLTKTL